MSLSHIFVPRNRKVDFTVDISIEDLANVPLVTGLFYVKWKLQHAEKSSGSTERAFIKDYSVFWNHNLSNKIQLVVGSDGYLMPCEFRLTIKQELKGGKEINTIGSLSLNLSEYVDSGKMTRRYLLQKSKINSTIKLSIETKHTTFGDVEYKVPQLKKTQIFGGITGIITERKELQDDERSKRAFKNRSNFGPHYLAKSRSTTSLRSSDYAQSPLFSPIVTSSLAENSFLRDAGERSPTDVVEDIFANIYVHAPDDDGSDSDNKKQKK
ncbi:8080_t:CDS:2 [Ambispora gerdemannii]|uniref:8080_t:CDS:1 n=1 Tax=Ambispora gerdemannii TaxID=144530 RepID=A0A9N8WF77_9GLOM|nr:8080_t:CDS:2 [Ambispora gerdemannii]